MEFFRKKKSCATCQHCAVAYGYNSFPIVCTISPTWQEIQKFENESLENHFCGQWKKGKRQSAINETELAWADSEIENRMKQRRTEG